LLNRPYLGKIIPDMANTKSAKKAIRRQGRQYVKNLRRNRTYREARKEVLEAVSAGNQKLTNEKLNSFYKAVDKAAKAGGPLHKNTAARYKANLTNRVNTAFAS
jgi:ribosomal protein S20